MGKSNQERRVVTLDVYVNTGLSITQKSFNAEFCAAPHLHRDPEALPCLTLPHPSLDLRKFHLSDRSSVRLAAQDPAVTDRSVLANYVLLSAPQLPMAKQDWERIVIRSSIRTRFGGGLDSFVYANQATRFSPLLSPDCAANNVLPNIIRIGVTGQMAVTDGDD